MNLPSLIEKSLHRVVDLRHRLHQIPELGYEEVKTAAALRAELDVLGIPHVDGVPDAPTATIDFKRPAAPISVAECPSCPQACIRPSCVLA